ncbi:hypothetical protein D9757_009008 [Collybiopsis confluens]|uniref:Uncharacterized protein n=1 Tax=Collybiopsis confluens TaxID=2823264 RepID=A0A8H5H349_9AGAR|nr:hypothetical protein D9757_009008 [Collybiopsis confluens]
MISFKRLALLATLFSSTLLAASAFPLPDDGDHAITSLNRRLPPLRFKIVRPGAVERYLKLSDTKGPIIFVGTKAFGMRGGAPPFTVFDQSGLATKAIINQAHAGWSSDKVLVLGEDQNLVRFPTRGDQENTFKAILELKPRSAKEFVDEIIELLSKGGFIKAKPTIDRVWYEDQTAGANDSQHPHPGASSSGTAPQPAPSPKSVADQMRLSNVLNASPGANSQQSPYDPASSSGTGPQQAQHGQTGVPPSMDESVKERMKLSNVLNRRNTQVGLP